jgi:hypothetical protein
LNEIDLVDLAHSRYSSMKPVLAGQFEAAKKRVVAKKTRAPLIASFACNFQALR